MLFVFELVSHWGTTVNGERFTGLNFHGFHPIKLVIHGKTFVVPYF